MPGLPHVTRLGPEHLDAMTRLQDAVTRDLPEGYIRPKTPDDLAGYADGRLGAAFGIVADDALLAMSLLLIPSEERPNPGTIPVPRVPAEDWPLHACFLANTMVLPDARGRGYQRALIEARFVHAAHASMKWVCAGVHLANTASWRNLLARGMTIVGLRLDFGYPVIGLIASLGEPLPVRETAGQMTVGALDHTRHEFALKHGYVGVRIAPDGGVVYRRAASDQR
jgi:GNAT superfamily N-acetyltransferase